jgi:hypothetical protein
MIARSAKKRRKGLIFAGAGGSSDGRKKRGVRSGGEPAGIAGDGEESGRDEKLEARPVTLGARRAKRG